MAGCRRNDRPDVPECAAEHGAERQGGFNREIGEFALPAGRRSIGRDPRINRCIVDPKPNVTPPDKTSVVVTPVGDPVFHLGDVVAVRFVVLEPHADLGLGYAGSTTYNQFHRDAPTRRQSRTTETRAQQQKGLSGAENDLWTSHN